MTPTVLIEYKQQRKVKMGYEDLAVKKISREYAEKVGESEGAAFSPRRVDSEDSSAPKRKIINLNDGFDVKREIFVPSKMSSSERRFLRKRFRSELDLIRDLQNKPVFSRSVAANGAAAFSSSAAPHGKKRPRGSHVIRGAKGRFLPSKDRTGTYTGSSDSSLLKQCEAVLKKLMTQKCGWVFNSPVDVEKLNIPDYFDIIHHPMDLGTIKQQLTSGWYTSLWDFAADVRLTFTNAMTYNPPGHDVYIMAETMSKLFEARWKPIEKKLNAAAAAAAAAANACANNNVGADRANSMRRNAPPVDHSDLFVNPRMTCEEKDDLINRLSSFGDDMPPGIADLLRQYGDDADQSADGVLEVDINAIGDEILLKVKEQLDNIMMENKQIQEVKSEQENEGVNLSGLSHSSPHPKGGEPLEEDVDICGNASPILIGKDAQARSSKLSSSSGSSSGSGSSSSDSDSDSDSGADSHEKAGSPAEPPKGNEISERPLDQEKSDLISTLDVDRPANDLEPHEHDSQSKLAPEGEDTKSERQVSPDRLYRAAIMRQRYADVIVKARGFLNQGGNKQEELEKQQKEEKARLLAEANAALEARKAEAEVEAKRKRDLERERARQALQEMERTVEINERLHPEDLEMLGTATTEHILSSVDETSPEHSQDAMPCFVPGTGNPLQQLGLFMKADDDEEEEEPSSAPSGKET